VEGCRLTWPASLFGRFAAIESELGEIEIIDESLTPDTLNPPDGAEAPSDALCARPPARRRRGSKRRGRGRTALESVPSSDGSPWGDESIDWDEAEAELYDGNLVE